jgi:hypothetical protein
VGARVGVPAALQVDPRNLFERGEAWEPGRTGGGTTAGPAAPGTVAGGDALPRTGGSRAARLMGMAGSLMTTGGAVLWAARYRPRHAA